MLLIIGCEVNEDASSINVTESDKVPFFPESIPAGNDSSYDIKLQMNSLGEFEVEAKINIKNTSEDTWNELIFYFIPNVFTEQTLSKISHPLANPGTLSVQEVLINGEKTEYSIDKDTFKIPLSSPLISNGEVIVVVTYKFSLPENGLRYTKNNGNYYLAQFYPMLSSYREHRWNKEDYRFKGETYHTDFSDFNISYQLPEGYILASTSPNDSYPSEKQGILQAKNVKLFFAAILKNPNVIEKDVGHINIRVFGFGEDYKLFQEITDIASGALSYFEENIGPYPHDQLDIVLDGMSMEYPGIVTAHSIHDSIPLEPELLKKTVVHELAHQWFYGIISNDPYHEAWLDEGFAEFATGLYFYSQLNTDVPYDSISKILKYLEPLPVNLSLDEYDSNHNLYIYGKSNAMLWKFFEKRGGLEEAENFLKTYYQYYQYKEVNTSEFIRFTKHYFGLKDNLDFEEWLKIE